MRTIIRVSAALFIVAGAVVALIAAAIAVNAAAHGATSPYATYPEAISFFVALGGVISGASLVLVGGTAYLLSSIDERLEAAVGRTTSPRRQALDFEAQY